jgi:hypothetical protein
MPGIVGIDQFVEFWNSLIWSGFVRAAIIVALVVWLVLICYALAMTIMEKPSRNVGDAPAAESELSPMTGQQLKAELRRLGRTQSELAVVLGVSRSYVSHLIKGTKPFPIAMQQRCYQILESWQSRG